MRRKTKYMNGRNRGGTPGSKTDTTCPPGRNPKDYHRVAVSFHGGDMAYERYVEGGRKGYGSGK